MNGLNGATAQSDPILQHRQSVEKFIFGLQEAFFEADTPNAECLARAVPRLFSYRLYILIYRIVNSLSILIWTIMTRLPLRGMSTDFVAGRFVGTRPLYMGVIV